MKLSAENVADFLSAEVLARLTAGALAMLEDLQHMSEDQRSEQIVLYIEAVSIAVGVFRQDESFGYRVVKGLRLLQRDASARVHGVPCGSTVEAKELSAILGDLQVQH